MVTVEFVSATRASQAEASKTPLVQSIRRVLTEDVSAKIEVNNTKGLPIVYNKAIETSVADILVFIHDDVWIDDFFIIQHLHQSLQDNDIIGVAGSRDLSPGHAGWGEGAIRSGRVAHGRPGTSSVAIYGPVPESVSSLDGVFIAAKRQSLLAANVRFDPRFEFHHYDVDFCRSAVANGLKLSTWSIAITHASAGNFNSPEWRDSARLYREKWQAA